VDEKGEEKEMIENKFRAWDIKNKKYIEIIGFYCFGDHIVLWFLDGGGCPNYKSYHVKRIILEQYTGLGDKNGVEDYVGNIWEVEFEDKKIRFVREVELTWQGYSFDFRCLDGQISPVHAQVSEDGEIIGNIHE